MNSLRDVLQAAGAVGTERKVEATLPLPDPLASDWVAAMRRLGAEVPRDATLGQLTQRSDRRARELKDAGRGRDAKELTQAREEFLRDRERRAWALVKTRFAELDLPEKTYRSVKQEEAAPEAVLRKIIGDKGEQLRGTGAARLRELLLAK